MTRIRVATYNILMGGRRGTPVHEVVRRLEADVLLVNESPKQPLLWKRRCRALGERWGLRYVAGGRPAGSNLIVVGAAVAVKSAGSEKLKQPWFQPRRGIAWAQLRVEGRLFGAVSCHLSLDRERRLREVQRIIDVASGLRGPVIVAGDLNVTSFSPYFTVLLHEGNLRDSRQGFGLQTSWTPGLWLFGATIDHCLITSDLAVRRHTIGPHLGSDHRPVSIVLQ